MKKDADWIANVCMHPESSRQKSPQETAKGRQRKDEVGAKATHLPDPPFAAKMTSPNPHRCLSPLGLPKPHVEPPLGVGLAVTVSPQKVETLQIHPSPHSETRLRSVPRGCHPHWLL